jgi:hypothetical protein
MTPRPENSYWSRKVHDCSVVTTVRPRSKVWDAGALRFGAYTQRASLAGSSLMPAQEIRVTHAAGRKQRGECFVSRRISRRSVEGSAHNASASAEVVVGSKICLYWSRDGLVYVPAELLPALPNLKFLR